MCDPLRLGEPGPHATDVVYTSLDVAESGLGQSQPASQLMDRLRKAAVTRKGVALRPNDAHRQEVAVIATQPRQQPGAQERRFPDARRPEDNEQMPTVGVTQLANHIQRPADLDVTAEVHRGVHLVQRLPAAVGRPIRLIGGRPSEGVRADARRAQAVAQPQQPFGDELDGLRVTVHRDRRLRPNAEQVAALPFACDVLAGQRLQARDEDRLVEVFGVAVLDFALVRRVPVVGEQANNGFTAIIRPP